ncbi:HNH endonuclease [Marisediminicola senii]|uniref:HNH endonuclease n=1 Tax=Marisediminicola senii TaxID=2711233 RepID=UPI0013ECE129|nr:HNH endonuclease signature motif containing protein [Marisediminicola senii]
MKYPDFMPDPNTLTPEEYADLTAELGPDELNVLDGDVLLEGLVQSRRERAQQAAFEFARVDQFRRHREDCTAGRTDTSGLFGRALRAELAAALCIPEIAAEALLVRSRTLIDDLPETLWRLGVGRFSERHATIIADLTAGLTPEQVRQFEEQVLEYAETLTVGLFKRKAEQIKELVQAADMEQRHTEARSNREVWVEPGGNGMGWLTAYLPNVQIVAIDNRLTAAARSLQGDGEERTMRQLRADAFADILTDPGAIIPADESEDEAGAGAGSTGGLRIPTMHRGIRAEVSLIVPALSVMGQTNTPGMLEGGIPIDAETARELAGNATGFTRILTHPETGIVLSFGKDRYEVPTALKRYLRYRDQTCRFIGCTRKAKFCDIDHTIPWAGAGETTHQNLAHLCRSHHQVKDAGWAVTQAQDGSGTVTWTSPLGRKYSTEAVHPIGGKAAPPAPPSTSAGSGGAKAQTEWLDDPPPF